jgi:hypothetical protein
LKNNKFIFSCLFFLCSSIKRRAFNICRDFPFYKEQLQEQKRISDQALKEAEEAK